MEFLRNTLDIIQAVDSDDELDTFEFLFQSCDALLNLGFLEAFVKFLGIDADGECADSNEFALKVYAVRCCCKTPSGPLAHSIQYILLNLQDAGAAAEKVARIIIGVEANQIAVEHTKKDLVSYG